MREVDAKLRCICNLSSHFRCAHDHLNGPQFLALFVCVPKQHELPAFSSFSETTLPLLDIPCNPSMSLAPQSPAYLSLE